MKIKPLKNNDDYEVALTRIEVLMDAPKLSEDQSDELEVLATLVHAYEEVHFPIDAPDPIALIEHCMEALGFTRKDLVKMIGSRSKVSEVLNKKRKLSMEMVRNLNKKMGIPAEGLIREYKLRTGRSRRRTLSNKAA